VSYGPFIYSFEALEPSIVSESFNDSLDAHLNEREKTTRRCKFRVVEKVDIIIQMSKDRCFCVKNNFSLLFQFPLHFVWQSCCSLEKRAVRGPCWWIIASVSKSRSRSHVPGERGTAGSRWTSVLTWPLRLAEMIFRSVRRFLFRIVFLECRQPPAFIHLQRCRCRWVSSVKLTTVLHDWNVFMWVTDFVCVEVRSAEWLH